ncbi:MAG: hypothetical protein OXN26_11685 [Gammaproteobacteria bacterium]|nr:hypothetical protein [Gammaproteobacteria bacterium]
MPLSIKSGMSPLFLARSAEVVLGIALALALADFAGLLLPGHGDKEPPAFAPDVQDVPARTTATASAGKGASRHLSPAVLGLFGQPENAAPVLVDDTIKETALDLRLKGILARRGTARQVALIAQGDDEETVYRLGDRIAGAEITHIEARRVVLLRNGRREALLLETDEPRRGSSFRK